MLGLLSLERFRMQGSFGLRFCRKLGHVGACWGFAGTVGAPDFPFLVSAISHELANYPQSGRAFASRCSQAGLTCVVAKNVSYEWGITWRT